MSDDTQRNPSFALLIHGQGLCKYASEFQRNRINTFRNIHGACRCRKGISQMTTDHDLLARIDAVKADHVENQEDGSWRNCEDCKLAIQAIKKELG